MIVPQLKAKRIGEVNPRSEIFVMKVVVRRMMNEPEMLLQPLHDSDIAALKKNGVRFDEKGHIKCSFDSEVSKYVTNRSVNVVLDVYAILGSSSTCPVVQRVVNKRLHAEMKKLDDESDEDLVKKRLELMQKRDVSSADLFFNAVLQNECSFILKKRANSSVTQKKNTAQS